MKHPIIIPGEIEFSMKPPPQFMWLEKDFDVRIRDALKYKKELDGEMRAFFRNNLPSTHMMRDVTLLRKSAIGTRKEITSPSRHDLNECDFLLSINFLGPVLNEGSKKSVSFFRMEMPLKDELYIIPYVFKVENFKFHLFPLIVVECLHVIPERWDELRRFGLIRDVSYFEMTYNGNMRL